jgi:hypothetical protein
MTQCRPGKRPASSVILVGDESAHRAGQLALRREPQLAAQTERLRLAGGVEIDARVDHLNAAGVYPIVGEHVSHRGGDGNDPSGAAPEPGPSQVEVHPAGGDQRGAGEHGDQAGEGHGVGVVGVEQGGARAHLAQDGEKDPRVEARAPPGLVHPDVVLLEPEGQLGSRAGDDDLTGETGALQFPSEKPDLTLPPAPLTAGGDVDDRRGHVSGSASSGRLSRRRT